MLKGRGKPRRFRFGLRARVTATFGLGALVLSVLLVGVTYFTVRQTLIRLESNALQGELYNTALLVNQNSQEHPTASPQAILESLPTQVGVVSLSIFQHGQQFCARNCIPDPPSLVSLVENRLLPAELWFDDYAGHQNGTPSLAIGVPVAQMNAFVVEIFDVSSLETTLNVLLLSLVFAALLTTVGGAIVGRWAAGRALRPLHDVAQASLAIAGGQLDTRLDTTDATDLGKLASSFNRMADRLQERLERDARFASDVSHELRSPLTTLVASVDLLEARRSELSERSQRALDLLTAEVRRFQRMVTELLEISRIDAGSADLSVDDVAVGELVRQTVAQLKASGPFPVDVSDEAERQHVAVDKRRFTQIIANLVDNANQYAGGVTQMKVDSVDHVVHVAVEDEGPGIPPEDRDVIFDRFSRGSTAGRRGSGEGTGLGLALVAEHVRLHGGRVWVESSDHHGARFVVELPVSEESGDGADED
jgi:signal transduction histidine kinase